MLRILTFTTLYPNSVQIRHGIFVEQRLRQLVNSGQIEAIVIAPVPWFPFKSRCFGRYGEYACVPRVEQRWGLQIYHPRYLMIPKVGMIVQPLFVYLAALSVAKLLRKNGYLPDVIDGHYFYPDGVAAAMLARRLSRPLVVTARGSDINLIALRRFPRRMIKWAGDKCDVVIAVSAALKEHLKDIGVAKDKIKVLRNGVDLTLFCPGHQHAAITDRKDKARTLLSVGHLKRAKGHHLVIAALRNLPRTRLIIVGEGSERDNLQSLAENCGVSERVSIVSTVAQELMPDYYRAADVLVLASEREGMPNVILESLACGTPVVAAAVGGVPEILTAPESGVLMSCRTPESLCNAIESLFANYPRESDVRRFAEKFSWEQTTRTQIEIFRSLSESYVDTTSEEESNGDGASNHKLVS